VGTLNGVRSANRDVDNAPPGPFQDCRECVHIALFFDGTGNNRLDDDAKQSWSNVARLFFAARDDSALGIYRIYISGVGTRYNASRNWAESIDSWIEDMTLGNAGGLGGDRRLDGGDTQMNDALERTLLQNAKTEGGKAHKVAQRMEGEGFEKMIAALANHRLIKTITFSIFGFSRGAALARAFTNRLTERMTPAGAGTYRFQGVEARINFLGIFDTVASFGLPGTNWGGWKTKDLTIPPHVEMCHHFAAAHEVRFSFPVDLIRDRSVYHGNMLEKVYPGVHSDVGGGYDPGKQGRKDTLARVPLQHMLEQAVEYGVRLHSFGYLAQYRAAIAQRIAVDATTAKAYSAYLSECAPGEAPVEHQIQRHMQQYFAYRGTLHRRKVGSDSANQARLTQLRRELAGVRRAEAGAESTKWREFSFGTVPSWWDARKKEGQLEDRISQLEAEVESAEKDAQRLAASDDAIAVQAYALQRAIERNESLVAKDGQLVLVLEKHTWMLDAWKRTASPAVIQFFDTFVHDSRTDFLGGREPFVYFRNRGVHEQARRPAGAGGSW
jgi:Uncharacterized alpha/beta hydrolase domain (DUF2235)